MGEIIYLNAYRANSAAPAAPGRGEAAATPPAMAKACENLAAGMRQMGAAARLLAEAAADLRDLAGEAAPDRISGA